MTFAKLAPVNKLVPNPVSLQLVLRHQAARVQHRLVRDAACDTNRKVRRDGVHPIGTLLVVYRRPGLRTTAQAQPY